jgi:hypothetical protein
MEIIILIATMLFQNLLNIIQVVFIGVWIFLIRKYKVSGQKTALVGFIFLFATMICSLFYLDSLAGIIAEFVWILFAISFVQEFYHFLKYENK